MTREQYIKIKTTIDSHNGFTFQASITGISLGITYGIIFLVIKDIMEIKEMIQRKTTIVDSDMFFIGISAFLIFMGIVSFFIFSALLISRGTMLKKLKDYPLDEKEEDLEKVLSQPEFAPLFK